MPERAPAGSEVLLLYDGRCGLCDRLVRFALARDRRRRLLFAPLQSRAAAEILARHGHDPTDLDTLYAVLALGTLDERALTKARAVLRVLREVGSPWRVLAALVGVLPTPLLDFLYDQVARRRLRLFGRLDACRGPDPRDRDRFLGLDEGDAE